jgi:hypothetical protein
MTATRRLVASLAADVCVARASGWRVRKTRQRQLPSKAVTSVITQGGLQDDAAGLARPRRAYEGRQRASIQPGLIWDASTGYRRREGETL